MYALPGSLILDGSACVESRVLTLFPSIPQGNVSAPCSFFKNKPWKTSGFPHCIAIFRIYDGVSQTVSTSELASNALKTEPRRINFCHLVLELSSSGGLGRLYNAVKPATHSVAMRIALIYDLLNTLTTECMSNIAFKKNLPNRELIIKC